MYSRNTHGHYHHRRNYQATGGLQLMLLGTLIGSPFIFWLGFLEYATAPVILTATTTTTAFSAAIFGIGALVVYGAIGLAYLYSGAHECYKTDKGLLDLLRSRVVNKDGLSFKGITSSIGAVLWTPFLVLGGLSGMAVRAIVNAVSKPKSEPKPNLPPAVPESDDEKKNAEVNASTSFHSMTSRLSLNGDMNEETPVINPVVAPVGGTSGSIFNSAPPINDVNTALPLNGVVPDANNVTSKPF